MSIWDEKFQFEIEFTVASYLPKDLSLLEDKYLSLFSDLDREVAFQIAEKTGGKVKVYKYEHWIHLLVITPTRVIKIATLDNIRR